MASLVPLRALAALIRLQVPEELGPFECEGLWLRDARGSLNWLCQMLCPEASPGNFRKEWPGWRDIMLHHPGKLKGMPRRAVQLSGRRETLQEGWQHCSGLGAKRLRGARAFVQQQCDVDQAGGFFCGSCQTRFRTKQQWALHAFKTHGLVKATRRLVTGSQCPCCLRQLATNIALCNHLDRSAGCRLDLAPEPGLGNRRADCGHDFISCSKQGFGPHLPVDPAIAADDAGATDVSAAILHSLEACLADTSEPRSFATPLDSYRLAFCSDCTTCEVLTATAEEWRWRRLTSSEALSIRAAALHTAVASWVCSYWTVDWLLGVDAPERPVHYALARPRQRGCASSIDFPEVVQSAPVEFCPQNGFFMGEMRDCSAGGAMSADWSYVFSARQCVYDSV